jgi:hypothetical protein
LFFFFLSVSSSSFSATAADLSSSLSFHGFLSFLLTLSSHNNQELACSWVLFWEERGYYSQGCWVTVFGKKEGSPSLSSCMYTPLK